MDALIALLDERKQLAASVYDSIALERAITRQADTVLRCASQAAVAAIRRFTILNAIAQGAT